MSSSEVDSPNTKSIKDVLKGSFWEPFSEDREFLSAVHHYYAVVQKCYSESFHKESLDKLISENERVQTEQLSGEERSPLAPFSRLAELISKAAVNERATTITFPDGKTGDTLYAEYIARAARSYHKSGAGWREELREKHPTHPEECFFR
jgi:hypothetical protein